MGLGLGCACGVLGPTAHNIQLNPRSLAAVKPQACCAQQMGAARAASGVPVCVQRTTGWIKTIVVEAVLKKTPEGATSEGRVVTCRSDAVQNGQQLVGLAALGGRKG